MDEILEECVGDLDILTFALSKFSYRYIEEGMFPSIMLYWF
jgi:hypothetical protein